MKIEDFKKQFIALINWGWSGEYAEYLLSLAADRKKLAKVYSRTRLVAYRTYISEHDALHHLISSDKLRNI